LLTGLSYAIESGLIRPEIYITEQLNTVSHHLQVAAICNYILLAESIISLITIIKQCRGYWVYWMAAVSFIIIRLLVVGMIVYESVTSHQHQRPVSQQLWRLNAYAILLGLFEVMIVGLQIGTISRLSRKLQFMSKSPDE
jgi:hypothetical protein